MRLRATRLSATGGHTRKRGIDIAALFAGYPGRVGCYYGTKSGPSYSDILARNREALGPESLSGGASFTLGSSTAATLDASTGQCTVYRTDVSNQSGIRFPAIVGKTYLVDVVVSTGSVSVRSGSIEQAVIATVAAGSRAAVLVVGGGAGYVSLSSGSGASVCRVISVREIADWSKLVYSDDPTLTVPVFSVFQTSRGRGLLLDASQGLVRGPELITNGDFSAGSSNWSVVNTDATHTIKFSAAGARFVSDTTTPQLLLRQSGTLTVGKFYEITVKIGSLVSGAIKTDSFGAQIALPSAAGTYIFKGIASTVNFELTRSTTNVDATIASVSVRELPGNHMQQPTAAARGELSARYNLYDGSEGVNGLVPNGASVSLGYLQEAAANSAHYALLNNSTIPAGAGVTTTFRAKGRGRNLRLACTSTAAWVGGTPVATFDLTAGTSSATGGATASIAPVAGQPGVYDCTIVATMGASSTSAHVYPVLIDAGGNTTYLGDGVSGVELIRRDTRLSADAIPSIPAYQRVTSATDYDDVGFPVYWRGQTDDWAKSRINPSGATKVLAMWGGQKMSEAASGMVFETSQATASFDGTLHLSAPPAASTNNYQFASRGTTRVLVSTGALFAAPRRSLVRCHGDISNDVSRIHVDGYLAADSTADQGTGSYTEQDVYFGARAGTSLFANVREFAPPLILFQPAADTGLSASQITALDKAYAKAAGVTL